MKVSEVFATIQGEGPNVGKPTTFIRFGGCNLRCPGWPCDTQYAIQPEFRDEWEQQSVDDILRRVPEWPRHVSLTGGEPLIQAKGALDALAFELVDKGHTIDLFTNGTRRLPDWVLGSRVTVCMDWKMPSSGEYKTFDETNLSKISHTDMIKFVIDIEKLEDQVAFFVALEKIKATGNNSLVYIGPVWGSDVHKLANWVVGLEERVEYPLRLNVQTHKLIYPAGVDGTSTRENIQIGVKT